MVLWRLIWDRPTTEPQKWQSGMVNLLASFEAIQPFSFTYGCALGNPDPCSSHCIPRSIKFTPITWKVWEAKISFSYHGEMEPLFLPLMTYLHQCELNESTFSQLYKDVCQVTPISLIWIDNVFSNIQFLQDRGITAGHMNLSGNNRADQTAKAPQVKAILGTSFNQPKCKAHHQWHYKQSRTPRLNGRENMTWQT